MKPSITKGEFNKLWKKRHKIALEFPKKTKKIKFKSKKDIERLNQIKKITEKLDEKTIKFKSWFVFFIFSIYIGIYMGYPFWAIKNSAKYFWKAVKYLFVLKPYGLEFKWHKLKEEYCLIDSSIYPYRKPKK